MSPWEAILLGLVQGATEFLPVSSSGHLVAGQTVLGIGVPGVVFEVAVHIATLVSVLLVYRGRVAQLAGGAFRLRGESWRYVGLLAVATAPAAFVGVLFGDAVESLFEHPAVVGVALIVTGAILWSSRAALGRATGSGRRIREAGGREAGDGLGIREAALIGVAQAFALIPGISRSGMTVVAGLWLGVKAEEAAEFSFLMSVPAILGAAILQLPELRDGSTASLTTPLLLGGIAAATTGVLAIRIFVALLRRGSFHHFATYLWTVGFLFLTYLWIR